MNNVVQVIRKTSSSKQVVMFPFGGGSGFSYMGLIENIDRDIEVVVINPPGHFFDGEKPLEHISEMVSLYSTNLRPLLKENPLFFGHSIGGLVAYEVRKKLGNDFNINKMIVSSVNPPHSTRDHVDMHSDMDTDTLVQKSTKMGGMPRIFKEEPAMLESFVNGLRGDLKALENFTPPNPNEVEKIDVTAVVLYSDRDYIVQISELKEWEHYLHCSEFLPFPGDHFYLFHESNKKTVARIIEKEAGCFV